MAEKSSAVAKIGAAKPMTFQDYHDRIEELKEKRGAEWRKHVPDDVNERSPRDARMATVKAENHPAVLAITGEIAELRAEQMQLGEPESDPGLTPEEANRRAMDEGRPVPHPEMTEG